MSVAETICVNAQGSAIGMPQLCADWITNQVFWLLVSLAVIYFALSKIALPRIGGVLASRRGTISSDLAAAEDFKQKAAASEAQYNETLAQAKAEAARIIQAAKQEFQDKLDAAIAKADAQITIKAQESEATINEIREGAKAAITEVAKDAAKEIVAVFDVKVDARTITSAVNAHLKG